jgi:hypothetical protein
MARDLADEIPQMAWINAQIILRAINDHALDRATRDVCQQYECLRSYHLDNQAFHASLLYCLIVFPKEFYDSVDLTHATEDLNRRAEIILKQFKINIWINAPRENKIYNPNKQGLITKVRNAVAHGRISVEISVDRSFIYTFWDQRNERSERTFECQIGVRNLGRFLSIVGRALANIRAVRNHRGASPPS